MYDLYASQGSADDHVMAAMFSLPGIEYFSCFLSRAFPPEHIAGGVNAEPIVESSFSAKKHENSCTRLPSLAGAQQAPKQAPKNTSRELGRTRNLKIYHWPRAKSVPP